MSTYKAAMYHLVCVQVSFDGHDCHINIWLKLFTRY